MGFVEELPSSEEEVESAPPQAPEQQQQQQQQNQAHDNGKDDEHGGDGEENEEKLAAAALSAKDDGNALFGKGEFEAAIARYSEGIEAVSVVVVEPEPEGKMEGNEGNESGSDSGSSEETDGEKDERDDGWKPEESPLLAELREQEHVGRRKMGRRRPSEGGGDDQEEEGSSDNEAAVPFDAVAEELPPMDEDREERSVHNTTPGGGDKGEDDGDEEDEPDSVLRRDTSVAEERVVASTRGAIPPRLHAQVAPLFCNRSACHAKLGAWRRSLDDAVVAFSLDPTYSKALVRCAQAREELGQLKAALTDYEKALELTPNLPVARDARRRLPPLIAEQEERDKAEMVEKLKGLGNSFLGLFGMSTDNFQFNQDPQTGGYSVNFKR
jgi:tetratricopeptide (TPR) repeat protein